LVVLGLAVAALSLQQAAPATMQYAGVMLGIFGLCVGALLYLFLFMKQQRKREALRALELADVDRMDPLAFEEYIAELLRAQGYRAKTTKLSGDFGIDVMATKDGVRVGIQAKHYASHRTVGVDAVSQVAGGKPMKQYRCDQLMVVTNRSYTKPAEEIAKAHDCALVDREQLAEWILALQTNERRRLV
jgi:restriction system protein